MATTVLQDIVESNTYEVVAVVTNPDVAIGRSSKLQASPVGTYAASQNIPVHKPKKIRNNESFHNTIQEYQPDYLIVVAY